MATELELWCYGIGQGDKLSKETDPYRQGMHVEAIRRTMLGLVRLRAKEDPDMVRSLIRQLKEMGIELNLDGPINEGTGKP